MTTNNNIADAQLEFGKDLALRTHPKGVTEQHIFEAYEKAISTSEHAMRYPTFRAGYLALLNELEFGGFNTHSHEMFYRLPEGVTKP